MKYKRFKVGCAYKNTGSSHLKSPVLLFKITQEDLWWEKSIMLSWLTPQMVYCFDRMCNHASESHNWQLIAFPSPEKAKRVQTMDSSDKVRKNDHDCLVTKK